MDPTSRFAPVSTLLHTVRDVLARLLRSRVRLPTEPIPASWPALVEHHVPLAARLAPRERQRLYRLMQLFLEDVGIEGCAGLEVTEEIRVTIAAQACLLLLKMDHPKYTHVRHVLVYPSSFVPKTVALHATGQIVRPEVSLRGQAWQSGVLVLGWDAVKRDTYLATDGDNVVLHEFAHMLDAEDGRMDGVPVFETGSAYRAWGALLSERFAEHVERTEAGEPTALRPYGAENRAEFFAVATETFFEKPHVLRRHEPALYAALLEFFGFDPGSIAAPPDAGSAT